MNAQILVRPRDGGAALQAIGVAIAIPALAVVLALAGILALAVCVLAGVLRGRLR